jgi:hypothetical protein
MKLKPIDAIDGISTGHAYVLKDVMSGVELASSLISTRSESPVGGLHRVALLSAIHTVNSLLAASSAKCSRAAPPADIDLVTDSSGDLIYRCQHKSPHSWKLDGDPI